MVAAITFFFSFKRILFTYFLMETSFFFFFLVNDFRERKGERERKRKRERGIEGMRRERNLLFYLLTH